MAKIVRTNGGMDKCMNYCNYEICRYHMNSGLGGTPQNIEEARECKQYLRRGHWWELDEDVLSLYVEEYADNDMFCEPLANINVKTMKYDINPQFGDPVFIHEEDYDCEWEGETLEDLKKRIIEYIKLEMSDRIDCANHVLINLFRAESKEYDNNQ